MILFLGRYLIGVLECHQLINLESFITTGKKSSSRLSGGLCCYVSFWFWRLRPEKKVLVICLAGCAVVSVFGSGDYDRKKKVLVVCLAGCAVVSVFGSGGK